MGRLSPTRMYAALLAGDAAYNGRFFTGVLTTGIYCLPSCKARKPKRDHVRFFPTTQAAREAGLRPCKKCHPDDFARGADATLETMEALAGELRRGPGEFANAAAVVRRSGFGATRLFELFRQHYQATTADFLLKARLAQAGRQLIDTEATLAAIASEAGFESLSAFHENFRKSHGMTPAAFRELRTRNTFEVTLPPGYPLAYLRRALSRDAHSVTERLAGDTYTTAARRQGEAVLLRMRLRPEGVAAEVSGPAGCGVEAHAMVARLLGLEQDATAFARLARRLGLGRLVAGREEMRLPQMISVFDGLLWAIIGQQITVVFACQLRRRLVELVGTPAGEGLYAPPEAEAVAALSRADLIKLQFSRQKAEYTLGLARLVAEGKIEPEKLHEMSATRAERTLLGIHGLGPWSVNFIMMRTLGFGDCVPWGDTGVSSGLQRLFGLEERPDIAAARRLMAVFSPHRSLATAHLWQFEKTIPE